MKAIRDEVSWKFLDEFRGKVFNSEWPTLPEMFKISQLRYPARPCFVDFEGMASSKRSLSYTQVWSNILSLACWLKENKIKKGDHIALTGKNSPEWATTYFGIMLAGGIAIPIDYALHENEIENLLKTAKPKMFFVDEEKFEYFSSTAKSIKIYSLSPKHEDKYIYNLKPKSVEQELPEVADTDTAAILFTSGTTGTPKGVMLSHKNLVCDSFIAQQNLWLYPSDVFYALLPLHHAYTMQAALIVPLSVGASVVFGKSMAVSRLMKELKEGAITVMLGVPLLYNKLYSGIMKGIAAKGKAAELLINGIMNLSYVIRKTSGKNVGKKLLSAILEKANLSTVRIAICGGGPLASSIFRGYNSLGIDFIQGYGLTETAPIIALNPLEYFKIESVGKDFYPYEEIKILNPNADGIGEIAVKGPMVMQGYYNMPEETAAMFTEDGFLKTGDLGWLDSEHYLMLSGRSKNLIVTEGGKNVYPEEIEDAFQLYYDVEQIMVRGYIENTATKSEAIEALIYPADDLLSRLNVTREEAVSNHAVADEIKNIVDKVNHTLQPYARISKITILAEALEMTTTKKVKRLSANVPVPEVPAEETPADPEKPIVAEESATPAESEATIVAETAAPAEEKPKAKRTTKKTAAKKSEETSDAPAEKKKATRTKKAETAEEKPVKKAAAKKTTAKSAEEKAEKPVKKTAAKTTKKAADASDEEKPAKKTAARKSTAKSAEEKADGTAKKTSTRTKKTAEKKDKE